MSGGENTGVEISVVIPVKDEEHTLEELCAGICRTISGQGKSFEIIFIDDGSEDGSFQVMEKLHRKDPRVRVVKFLKNFGKSAALSAGFMRARGKIIVTMDADLQDDPAEIPKLLEALQAGAHLVTGWKKERQDPSGKKIASKIANAVTGLLSGVRIHDMNCGFKAYQKKVVETVSIYGDLHRFIPMLAAARGFKVVEVPVKHHPRKHGRSKYGIERMPRGFFDLLTVLFLTQYARRPLHLFGGIGASLALIGGAMVAFMAEQWLVGVRPIGNRPFFLGGIMLLLLGAQLLSLGLVGELVTHVSMRSDDQYIVEEALGD